MTYNMTFGDTSNNMLDIVVGLNNATEGWISVFILFMVFMIMLISMKAYETKVVLMSGGAVTTLLAIMFWAMGLIGFGYIFIPVVVLFTGLIWMGLSN